MPAPPLTSATMGARTIGPFTIGGARVDTAAGVVWDGWDPLLRRRVWVHQRLAGAPPLSEAAQRANRPTRLRWLQCYRSSEIAWDGLESSDGAPLRGRQVSHRPDVAGSLADRAIEIQTRRDEGDLPELAYGRIWITRSGRAILLDIPVVQPSGMDERVR
jgi:hypothetical protein